MQLTARQALETAQALIADERNWCQKKMRDTTADGTCRFCAWGAIVEALGDTALPEVRTTVYEAIHAAAEKVTDGKCLGPVTLNDSRDHETVMRMFAQAIELVK